MSDDYTMAWATACAERKSLPSTCCTCRSSVRFNRWNKSSRKRVKNGTI